MRLTYKLEKPIDTKYLHYDYMCIADYDISRGNYGRITDSEIYNKLGQLEDIEDEFGIDLATLFKALKNGFYYKDYEENPDGIISFVEKNDIMLKGNIGFNRIATYDSGCFMFKDYGKTWALTREELL